MLFCYITYTDMLCTVSVTRTFVNKKFMKSQKDVLGNWSKHSQMSWYGKPFWGENNA